MNNSPLTGAVVLSSLVMSEKIQGKIEETKLMTTWKSFQNFYFLGVVPFTCKAVRKCAILFYFLNFQMIMYPKTHAFRTWVVKHKKLVV